MIHAIPKINSKLEKREGQSQQNLSRINTKKPSAGYSKQHKVRAKEKNL
jgi:hypothetical protein